MKYVAVFAMLAAVSLLIMTLVDYLLGEKAEFLNAWSVIERLIGRAPASGDSEVFRQFGAAGEFACVILVNLAIGALLTALIRRWVSN
jgi:hypothetical protein